MAIISQSCLMSTAKCLGLHHEYDCKPTLRSFHFNFLQRYPADRSYFIAKEILMTERTYKKDLEILNLVSKACINRPRNTNNSHLLFVSVVPGRGDQGGGHARRTADVALLPRRPYLRGALSATQGDREQHGFLVRNMLN